MKNIFVGIFLGLTFSCASEYVTNRLVNRTLVVHPDLPALAYPHCTDKYWLSDKCKKDKKKVDLYDLNDPSVRKTLSDFVCVHASKF